MQLLWIWTKPQRFRPQPRCRLEQLSRMNGKLSLFLAELFLNHFLEGPRPNISDALQNEPFGGSQPVDSKGVITHIFISIRLAISLFARSDGTKLANKSTLYVDACKRICLCWLNQGERAVEHLKVAIDITLRYPNLGPVQDSILRATAQACRQHFRRSKCAVAAESAGVVQSILAMKKEKSPLEVRKGTPSHARSVATRSPIDSIQAGALFFWHYCAQIERMLSDAYQLFITLGSGQKQLDVHLVLQYHDKR
ncbi:uncharacterized protein EI90DRAFT_3019579 [Cantharellus anzutake]|uniref:uncharacterized protein n=1 Tax=Cantharellus anzutake TaxID=1750568 RepID=UPI001907F8FB|nr:uncharacterized protein EI90DRAFT_3019579 [Cantharellus anzutake]KAF8324444.1 hypothetical protein EI90DRAFT_3019579 [Cantharellus anzutake]